MRSHPVWVCGLKPPLLYQMECHRQSHPVWVCGLKHPYTKDELQALSHTLYGCVDWNFVPYRLLWKDFRHTLYGCVDWNFDAQITRKRCNQSHPVWVCGLKLKNLKQIFKKDTSHPVWVCGLKLFANEFLNSLCKSHPVWVCGLKQYHYRKGY